MISRILNISEIIVSKSSAFLFGTRGTGKTVLGKKWLKTLSRGLGQPLAAIEIKSSTTINTKKLKGLYSFKKDYPDIPVYCFCRTQYESQVLKKAP